MSAIITILLVVFLTETVSDVVCRGSQPLDTHQINPRGGSSMESGNCLRQHLSTLESSQIPCICCMTLRVLLHLGSNPSITASKDIQTQRADNTVCDLSLETRDSRTRFMKLNNHPSFPPADSVDCVAPSPRFDGSHSLPSREEIISYIFKFLGIESRSISSVVATFIVILYCPPFLFLVIIIPGLEHIRHIAVFERTFQSTLVSPVRSP